MEVRPGYKQTEVGVIPEEWAVKPLGELAALRNGFAFRSDTYTTLGNLKVITIANVQDGYMSAHECNSIATEPRDLQTHQRLRRGDILISMTGNVGRVCRVTEEGCLLNQRVGKLIPIAVDSDFLFALLRQPSFLKAMTGVAKGGAQPNLSVSEISDHLFCVPTNGEEQRAIAAALSDVDELLARLDRLIAKKRDLKQAAMQQLLTGQTRLPGFQGEWELKLLGDLADVKTGPFGSSLHESDYVPDGTPIITVEHLGEFGVEHFNLPMVSDFDRRRLQAYSLDPGDIVFSRVGSVDRNALIRSSEAGWLFSGRLLRVRPDRRQAYAPFLSYQFHSDPFKALVRSVAVGQTMASLNTQILKGLNIRLPALDEQIAIAAVLSDMDAELTALEARRDKTRALKQGMMQELLTGRTRLV